MKKIEKCNLKIFKFNKNISLCDCFISEKINKLQGMNELEFTDNIKAKGYIWEYSNDNFPSWFEFVKLISKKETIENLEKKNKSFSCCVVLETECGIFGISFGQGYHYFNNIENDNFGFKVGFNSAKNFVQINSTTIQDNVKNKNTTIAKSSDINEFDIDENSDLCCDFKCNIKQEYVNIFGNSIKCNSESISIVFDIKNKTVSNVIELLKEVSKIYEKNDYKTNYPWIDNLKIVKDHAYLKLLEKEVCRLFKENNSNKLQLMFPEINYNNDEDFEFYYSCDTKKESHFELNIRDFFKLQKNIDSFENLKSIYLKKCDDNKTITNLYKIITAEFTHSGKTFVMYLGNIFEIENDFNEKIEENFKRYISRDIDFIEYDHDAHDYIDKNNKKIFSEDRYNKDLAKKKDWILLDKYKTQKNRFEICDLLKDNKYFIHIKHYNSSATFSHLFFQGVNSAKILINDSDIVKNINEEKGTKIDVNDIKVCYAIIKNQNTEENIPFFSKVSFLSVVRELNIMRCKDIGIYWINIK